MRYHAPQLKRNMQDKSIIRVHPGFYFYTFNTTPHFLQWLKLRSENCHSIITSYLSHIKDHKTLTSFNFPHVSMLDDSIHRECAVKNVRRRNIGFAQLIFFSFHTVHHSCWLFSVMERIVWFGVYILISGKGISSRRFSETRGCTFTGFFVS